MATVALTVGVSLIPGVGPIAAAALAAGAGAIGAYIDQNLISPALFPPEPLHGQRLNDLKLSSAGEGDGAFVAQGEGVRVPGTVIYLSKIIEEKHEQRQGKGGTVVNYLYFAHVAVSFAWNEIEDFDALIADGKTIWRRAQTTTITYSSATPPTSDLVVTLFYESESGHDYSIFLGGGGIIPPFPNPMECTISDSSLAEGDTTVDLTSVDRDFLANELFTVDGDTTEYVALSFSGGTLTFRPPAQTTWSNGATLHASARYVTKTYMVITSPNVVGAPDLTVFQSGIDVSVNGFPKDVNNGTFRCALTHRNEDGSTDLWLLHAEAEPDRQGGTVTLQQETPQFRTDKADSFTFYRGTETQPPDAFLESLEGEGNVPSRRGKAYVVIQKLNLTESGYRPPNFEAIIKEKTGRLVKDVFSFLVERAGLTSDQYDVSGIQGTG